MTSSSPSPPPRGSPRKARPRHPAGPSLPLWVEGWKGSESRAVLLERTSTWETGPRTLSFLTLRPELYPEGRRLRLDLRLSWRLDPEVPFAEIRAVGEARVAERKRLGPAWEVRCRRNPFTIRSTVPEQFIHDSRFVFPAHAPAHQKEGMGLPES